MVCSDLFVIVCLRVEFLLKTDSGYPKDTGVNNLFSSLYIHRKGS